MVRRDELFTDPLRQVVGDAPASRRVLTKTSVVRFGDQFRESVVDLLPPLVGRDRFDRESGTSSRRSMSRTCPSSTISQSGGSRCRSWRSRRWRRSFGARRRGTGHVLDRSNGRGESDPPAADRGACGDVFERHGASAPRRAVHVPSTPWTTSCSRRSRLSAVRAALVVGHRMDLVDDDGADGLEHRAAVASRRRIRGLGRRE